MTKFEPNSDGTQATSELKSMFKFPEGGHKKTSWKQYSNYYFFTLGSEFNFQCDIILCNGVCETIVCDAGVKGSQSNGIAKIEENMLIAATTVFVRDPADAPRKMLTTLKVISIYFIFL